MSKFIIGFIGFGLFEWYTIHDIFYKPRPQLHKKGSEIFISNEGNGLLEIKELEINKKYIPIYSYYYIDKRFGFNPIDGMCPLSLRSRSEQILITSNFNVPIVSSRIKYKNAFGIYTWKQLEVIESYNSSNS